MGPPSTPISTNAPTATPGMLPIPPTITTTSTMIDTSSSKLFGNTDPTLAAKSAPPNEARMAPVTNASSLAVTMLMPMASATCSSSRIAIQARPIRESCRRHEINAAITTNTSTM